MWNNWITVIDMITIINKKQIKLENSWLKRKRNWNIQEIVEMNTHMGVRFTENSFEWKEFENTS